MRKDYSLYEFHKKNNHKINDKYTVGLHELSLTVLNNAINTLLTFFLISFSFFKEVWPLGLNTQENSLR